MNKFKHSFQDCLNTIMCRRLFLMKLQAWGWKRDSGTSVFLWILQNFKENPFLLNTHGSHFCILFQNIRKDKYDFVQKGFSFI